jgi:multidrug efflux pump subunit AcrB
MDLGSASRAVQQAIDRAGEPPRGVLVNLRGQVPPMQQTLAGLQLGLGIAIVAIFLLLAGYFQSLRVAFGVLCTVPGILTGVVVMLIATGTTINVQSFMGTIMAIGVGVANAILLLTFAENNRRQGQPALEAAIQAGRSRLRPIMMTSCAMIAGMLPMALAIGEGGAQAAPLGRAVIGGLAASMIAVLTVLPAIYGFLQRNASTGSASMHPEDANPTAQE